MGRVDVGKIESRAVAKHAGELSLEYVRRKAFVDFGRVIEGGWFSLMTERPESSRMAIRRAVCSKSTIV